VLEGKKVKVNGIAGGVGLVLSGIIGIVSGGNVLLVFMRAFIFGVLFFVFAEIVQRLIDAFLPELLTPVVGVGEEARETPGSRIDISVGDENDKESFDISDVLGLKNPAQAKESPADAAEGAKDVMDQPDKKDYTQHKEAEDEPPRFVPAMPLAKNPAPEMREDVEKDPLFAVPESSGKPASGAGKAPGGGMPGKNMDPKQMASAIQTILKQE
jgi:hypothetical protein